MMEGLCFYSSKYRVTKGLKFHAQPQTGAYSCFLKYVSQNHFENDPFDELKKMPGLAKRGKSFSFSGSRSKTQNCDQNRIYPSVTLQNVKFFPLKRVFKNRGRSQLSCQGF